VRGRKLDRDGVRTMTRKLIVVSDTGIDGAFALTLALSDPRFEVLAVAATAGNVGHEQATRNAFTVVEQLDPPRWPRIGAALPVDYDRTMKELHGPDGLGGADLPSVQLHHPHPADRLIAELVRQNPGEVTVLLLGPATVLARAMDRDPELCRLLDRVVVVGGTRHEPGDASAVAEFHFWCDPAAARQLLRCGAPVTLLPLDVTNRLVYSPADLRQLPPADSRAGGFLRRVLPHAIAPTAGLRGTEGVLLNDAMGVAALAHPEAFTVHPICADVEVRGELTRGMSVFDSRWGMTERPNIDLATAADAGAVRKYIHETLGTAFS
ncbi:MAG: nucleoside hydrolase, partial [Gemmataceae bacterium]